MALRGIKQCWNFNLSSPDKIVKGVEELLVHTKSICDRIGVLKDSEINYDSVVKPLLDLDRTVMTAASTYEFPQHAATDKNMREASTAANTKIDAFMVEISLRKDVFNNVVQFKNSCHVEDICPEDKRYIERFIKNGYRNGLHLGDELLDQIKTIKQKMSELAIQFQGNLNEDKSQLSFTKEELEGVTDSLLDSLDRDEDGKYIVTMKYPHYFPVTRLCRVPDTRKKVETAYQSRCVEVNTKILEELVELRHKHATLLGYKSHAEYVLEMRMAKHPDQVGKFLVELKDKLKSLYEKERLEMLKMKEEECKKYGYEFNGRLDFWDLKYYMNQVEVTRFAVDQEELKPYFPVEVVTKELLAVYQELLQLQFTQVKGDTWHPDVVLYQVNDAGNNELLGYFFMDLFPREGKFGHAAVFPLQPSCLDDGEKRQVAVVALMVNFPRPCGDKPCLLDHKEVETFFHEFGHVMHQICSRAQRAFFSGTSVERDFVEAPSQMLENWVWEGDILRRLSCHYQTKEPLSQNVIDKLVKSKNANTAHFNLRQIVLATFDQVIHTSSQADTKKVFSNLFSDILGVETIPGTNMPASFGHVASGYDAQYYGYLWSEVYSIDMFSTKFEKKGVMDKNTGKKYRTCILEPGGSIDAIDMLRNFLGREPNSDAFLKSKGIYE